MQINLSPRVRATVYIVTAVGTPVVAYLLSKGIIGNLEVALWSAEVTVANTMAALNTSK